MRSVLPWARRLARRWSPGDERGVAVVEFALILPVLVMLLLGMLTAAIAWNQNLGLASAARVAGRFGATLPVTTHETLDEWLDTVAERALDAGEGNLDPGVPGRYLCVAYVHPAGTTAIDRTRQRLDTTAGVTYADSACFSDGQSNGVRRVQVVAGRTGALDVGLWGRELTLRREVVYRFEVGGGL